MKTLVEEIEVRPMKMERTDKKKRKIRVPESGFKRLVVIGGGFAGLALVKKLRNSNVQIVIIDKNNFHQFQPLLYQVATSGITPDSIAFPLRKEFKNYNNVFFRMAKVDEIDSKNKEVITNIGSLTYDYLVIATGSDTNFFGMKDVEENSLGMKSIQEALDIRSLMLQNLEKSVVVDDEEERNALTNFVVIGGGPAGVETAGALAEFKKHIVPKDYPDLDSSMMRVHLIEAGDRVLATMSDKASDKSLDYLHKLGVEVHLNQRVTSYDGNCVKTMDGSEYISRTVLWTSGVRGNIPEGITKESIAPGDRLLVNEYSEIIGHEDIYAIGDIAAMITEDLPKGHPMVAQVAIQQGELLSRNLFNKLIGNKMEKFVYNDKGSMATVGKRKAVADIGKFKFGGRLAWILWSVIHLVSIIGFRNKLIVGIHWLWSYVTYDRGNRLIVRRYTKKKIE